MNLKAQVLAFLSQNYGVIQRYNETVNLWSILTVRVFCNMYPKHSKQAFFSFTHTVTHTSSQELNLQPCHVNALLTTYVCHSVN